MGTRSILRLRQVIELTGYKRSSIYKMMRQSAFPQSRRIGLRAVGWDSIEVHEWIGSKLDNRG